MSKDERARILGDVRTLDADFAVVRDWASKQWIENDVRRSLLAVGAALAALEERLEKGETR